MDEICLSQGNSNRLRELGLVEAATVVLLPKVRFKVENETLQGERKNVCMTLREVLAAMPGVSDNEGLLDLVLQAFSLLVVQLRDAESDVYRAEAKAGDTDKSSQDVGEDVYKTCPTEQFDSSIYDSLCETLTKLALRSPGRLDKQYAALIAEAALASVLSLEFRLQNFKLPTSTLVAVTAYTDADNSWTTKPAASISQRIISLRVPEHKLIGFIAGDVLSEHVRVLISSPNRESANLGTPTSDSASILGDYENGAAMLTWAIKMTKGSDIGKYWHLFVPALIKLAENTEISIRVRGLRAITLFLAKCPPSTIYSTGMDHLFENTILPTLLLLPRLTPENDSVTLLKLGYTAAFQLALVDEDHRNMNRKRFLDTIVRNGILAGYYHASDHALVIDVLMGNMAKAVSYLGISATKHLTHLLCVIESVMTDSFAANRPEVLISASKALMAIIIHCWPRMCQPQRVEQMLRILSICWLSMSKPDGGTSQLPLEHAGEDAKLYILRVMSSLRLLTRPYYSELEGLFRTAISRDHRLRDLFVE